MFCVAVCARRRNARRAALAPRRGAQPEHGRTPLPTDTDTKIAPALLALGGWAEAEWFGPSVLSDPEVIAFEFPKLPGARKQAFHVVYRTRSEPPSRKKGTKVAEEPRRPPRRTAGKLAALLEDAGAVRTVASSRDRFLFDTGAVLFFAEVPSAKLKQRSANKLRQELVAIGFSACVLIVQKDLTTLMLCRHRRQASGRSWMPQCLSIGYIRRLGRTLRPRRSFSAPRQEGVSRENGMRTGKPNCFDRLPICRARSMP